MNKIKIIIDVERMKYPFTGLFYYCENLYENVYKNGNDEFGFSFFTHSSVKLPDNFNRINSKLWNKFCLIKPKKYKLWHITYQNSKYVPKGNIKVVYTIHDLNFLYTDKSEFKKKILLNKIQKIINRADYITVISNFVLQDVKKHLDVKNKPIKVIHNGVVINEFPNFNTPKYKPSKKYIFTLGTLLYKKHFHVLPQMVANSDYELVIGGIQTDSDYINQIKKEIEKHNVKSQVTLTGPISEEEKYWYMKNCSAFVFPSISEGFGIPPIEAMTLGKPVFLSKFTSLPEVGGAHAYYFDSFEKEHMQKVFLNGMNDYSVNNKEGKIKKWGKQFNWNKASNEYLQVYRNVLNNKTLGDEVEKNVSNNKFTALVITYNEEENIDTLLENLKFADEIIIIDSFSNDKTVDLVKKYDNVKLIQNKFVNFSRQRNFALSKASNDWVLFIDADERISDNLKNEIINVVNNNSDVVAYKVNRKNYIGTTLIKYSAWQNDSIYRFFNKKNAKYDDKKWVHETLIVDGKSKTLKNPLIHYTSKNFIDYKNKIKLYSEIKAKELYYIKMKPNFFHFNIKPVYRFWHHYIIRLGFLDGKYGKKIAKINAFGIKNRYKELKKLYQKK